jgi:hypothetical protein
VPGSISVSRRERDAIAVDAVDQARTREPKQKLHATLVRLVETKRTGKVEVQIWLADNSVKVIDELKKLGMEIVAEAKAAKMVIARVPIEKLLAIAALEKVQHIAPQPN